jgi:hypothetical protein
MMLGKIENFRSDLVMLPDYAMKMNLSLTVGDMCCLWADCYSSESASACMQQLLTRRCTSSAFNSKLITAHDERRCFCFHAQLHCVNAHKESEQQSAFITKVNQFMNVWKFGIKI